MKKVHTMKISQAKIKSDIESYGKHASTGKATFKVLSRNLLTYVYESNDVPLLNRHLDTLSPLEKRMAIQFYSIHVGWDFDKDGERFGKKAKTKIYDKKKALAEESLKDKSFDIWSWYEAKGDKPTKKAKDHVKALDNALKAGLKPKEGEVGITLTDLAKVFMANDIKMRDLMKAAEEAVLG